MNSCQDRSEGAVNESAQQVGGAGKYQTLVSRGTIHMCHMSNKQNWSYMEYRGFDYKAISGILINH